MKTLASVFVSLAFASFSTALECVSHSQPNPIAAQYPGNVTGTVNATLAILPIPFSLARSLIPKEYAILTSQYRSFLPELPKDMYPALLQTVRDHDIRFGEYGIPDFSSARIEFPFVDLLHDEQTSFRWSPSMFISSDAPMAIEGASEYGTVVYPATFDPACNAYEVNDKGETYLNVKGSVGGNDGYLEYTFSKIGEMLAEFPTQFYVNATNQPSFGDGKVCDEYIRYFDTEISKGEFAGVPITGSVKAKNEVFGKEMEWKGALGVHIDSAFIENHMVSCEGLRGYTGTGEQTVEIVGKSDRILNCEL